MKVLSYIFLSISAFFFWASQVSRISNKRKPVESIPNGASLTIGIFIEKVKIDSAEAFLCANSQIGFFYRDQIFDNEVLGRLAVKEEFDAVFEYLADKIDECEGLAGKLNALQRGVQEQQAV
jgi:hypothetical protein